MLEEKDLTVMRQQLVDAKKACTWGYLLPGNAFKEIKEPNHVYSEGSSPDFNETYTRQQPAAFYFLENATCPTGCLMYSASATWTKSDSTVVLYWPGLEGEQLALFI